MRYIRLWWDTINDQAAELYSDCAEAQALEGWPPVELEEAWWVASEKAIQYYDLAESYGLI